MSEGPQDGVARFAQTWFDVLSEHRPVDELLPLVADEGLEMVFPERTLRSHADFRDWYAVVGQTFTDQSHTIEEITAEDDGDLIDVRVTVVWRAKQTSDGSQLAARAHQHWRLRPEPGGPVIQEYRVLDLAPL